MAITNKQKEVAEKLAASIKEQTKEDIERIRKNIRKENEYMAEIEKAQKPTREQMQREYTI